MRSIPYTVSKETEQDINSQISEQLSEIAEGYRLIHDGKSRIALLQGIGRIEAACDRLTKLSNLIK